MRRFNEHKVKKHLSIALLLLVYLAVLVYLSRYIT